MINQLTQAGTHIDQVRELMFGPQLREFNQRLQQLESTIVQLVEGTQKHFNEIQESFAGELQTAMSSVDVTTQPASSSFCRSRLLVSFWGRDKGVAIKSLSDGFKDIFGMLARGGDIPANATESLGPLKRAKPT